MNRNLRIDENGTDHNAYGLRKISFWEKYGVKRFPYLGKRRYSPFAYRSVDGGIVISNDVFGLTIRQFDKMYKACLIRRKTHEQYILNLRYPDKSSDEYMEYLQDIKNNDKGNFIVILKLHRHSHMCIDVYALYDIFILLVLNIGH